MHNRNKRGPKIKPCGTPALTGKIEEILRTSFATCFFFFIYVDRVGKH